MGDATMDSTSRPPENPQGHRDDKQQGGNLSTAQSPGAGAPDSMPFHSQYSNASQQPHVDPLRVQSTAMHGMLPNQAVPFNMGAMAGALPDYGSQAHRVYASGSVPTSAHRGQVVSVFQPGTPYSGSYGVAQYHGMVGHEDSTAASFGPQGQRGGVIPPVLQQFTPYGPQLPQYFYPNPPYSPESQHQIYPGSPHGMSPYGNRRLSAGAMQSPQAGFPASAMAMQGGRGMSGMSPYGEQYGITSLRIGEAIQRPASGDSINSVPRGPPRKPKQSGHALWVGNLPPGTTVLYLKDHFSRDATKDIESLFLISKSNCAFVNYRTEASCSAAMHRFHDSRFHGVRLVCRLRSSVAPSGPSAMNGRAPASADPPLSPLSPSTPESRVDEAQKEGGGVAAEPPASGDKIQYKYFVVKSLTLQDLELSVKNGIWATQSHNEQALNKAFETAENVYLIFSANKSGKYFGYARMASPINQDGQQAYGATVPHAEPTESADAPKVIRTEPTEFAPKGRVIDDSARGTIFWEADLSDQEDVETGKEKEKETKADAAAVAESATANDDAIGAQTWGRPFKVEWLSTNRVPFYRTRGLRNPWNANREVKIARDGTELEPSVGNRLMQLFHHIGQPPPPPASGVAVPMLGGMGMGRPSQMRPY